jgi:hypothetical protein
MTYKSTLVTVMTMGLLACPAFGQPDSLTPDEQRLVTEFDAFAKAEWPKILEEIPTGMEHAVELQGATKIPMTKKHSYIVFWISEKPADYDSEVIRSPSLDAPYKGLIKFKAMVNQGSIIVKGPKAHCKEKPLKECLENGGKLADGAFSRGGDYTVTQPHEVVLSYVPGDATWTRTPDDSILDVIATIPSVSSLDK